ncbi:MAG: primosomal protein N' [Kiritimatiellae bacterium]|nr:primosomal protein N' [Kiritimatiellia bacterium]
MIARVATDISADRLFDYAVPAELMPRLCVGQRVRVPFGRRTADAYVVELTAETAPSPVVPDLFNQSDRPDLSDLSSLPAARHLRSLLAIEDDTPFLSPDLIRLARWIAEYTCTPLELCLRCALPAPVRNRDVRAKERLYVSPVAEAAGLTERQAELHADLVRVGGGWLHSLTREFSCSPQTLKALAAKGAAVIEARQMRRDPLARRKILPTLPMPLMPEQAAALEQIVALIESEEEDVTDGQGSARTDTGKIAPKPLLLFGVTGSGKTEVYLQAISKVLERGCGAIVLVPEIALTPQTVQRFAARFGQRVAVLHSALSDGERFDEWHRIRSGSATVVVGPRSAVFAPVRDLGLIVVDEEHEPSYKQDEAPRYNARDVAVMRGHLEKCAVVLGSATPAMETWLNVKRGKYALARLSKRVAGRAMPHVRLVDMRMESVKAGHARIFSEDLLAALNLRLERGEQSILFLNRRGYANSLLCPSCGHAETCEACNIAYTYHQADNCLRCHICGGWRHVPSKCPECGDPAFKYAGTGTQRAESALRKCFPKASVLRMDADVTSRKQSHDELLSIFKSGRADILLGTQMIAKGLDFPNVTLVGVLMADLSLNMPDFRAAERTYQLLAQVSGRAGRADLPGEVFIQTYAPEHPAVRAAASDAGFEPFAERELAEREEGGYPPYSRLVCLTFKGTSEDKTRLSAETLAKALMVQGGRLRVSAACPAPLAKAKGMFRYQVLMMAPTARAMTTPLRATLARAPLPTDVSLSIDVDALNVI